MLTGPVLFQKRTLGCYFLSTFSKWLLHILPTPSLQPLLPAHTCSLHWPSSCLSVPTGVIYSLIQHSSAHRTTIYQCTSWVLFTKMTCCAHHQTWPVMDQPKQQLNYWNAPVLWVLSYAQPSPEASRLPCHPATKSLIPITTFIELIVKQRTPSSLMAPQMSPPPESQTLKWIHTQHKLPFVLLHLPFLHPLQVLFVFCLPGLKFPQLLQLTSSLAIHLGAHGHPLPHISLILEPSMAYSPILAWPAPLLESRSPSFFTFAFWPGA